MEFEIVNRDKMKLYMKCWNYISWEEVTDNYGMLNSDCVALGIREGNIPLGIVIGKMTDEQIEIKIFETGSEQQKKALKEFYRRKEQGLLVKQLDQEHKIASFHDFGYSRNRY